MAPPRKIHVLEQDQLDQLLAWLDTDREQAGLVYEKIRRRLITIFAARDCPVAEELADETIDRVARRVAEIALNYTGDKALYFFGVANNVHHEFLKRPSLPESEEEPFDDEPDKELIHDCLEQCLRRLPSDESAMIVRYYSVEKHVKAELRKQMSEEYGISLNTLRLRVLRMKEKLQPCIERCIARKES